MIRSAGVWKEEDGMIYNVIWMKHVCNPHRKDIDDGIVKGNWFGTAWKKEYVKSYASKKAIYDDVQKAWDKGWHVGYVEAGSKSVCVAANKVYGPKFIGSVYKELKSALIVLHGDSKYIAMPQPEYKVENDYLF